MPYMAKLVHDNIFHGERLAQGEPKGKRERVLPAASSPARPRTSHGDPLRRNAHRRRIACYKRQNDIFQTTAVKTDERIRRRGGRQKYLRPLDANGAFFPMPDGIISAEQRNSFPFARPNRGNRAARGDFRSFTGDPSRMIGYEPIDLSGRQTQRCKHGYVPVFIQPHGNRAAVLSDKRIIVHSCLYCSTKNKKHARYFIPARHEFIDNFRGM